MKKKKRIKVNLGTDIVMAAPSHPYSVAIQIKRVIDRIVSLDDTEYEYSCNSLEGIKMFQYYGALQHSGEIDVWYYINGRKVSFEGAVTDLERGMKYVEEIIEQRK